MSGGKLVLVGAVVLFSVPRSQAQSPADSRASKAPQQLAIRIKLPTSIGLVKDYADVLLSKEEDKLKKLTTRRRPRTSNPTLVFTVPIPKNWVTKKLAKDE